MTYNVKLMRLLSSILDWKQVMPPGGNGSGTGFGPLPGSNRNDWSVFVPAAAHA